MRHTRLVRMMCFVMLAGAALGASARSSSDDRFFHGWFAQAADRPDERNDNHGGARPGPPRAPHPQEVRPQGDLRGDIYNHLREQRQSPQSAPPPPASDPRQRQRDRDRNGR
ncbi:hypothetical protein [Pandoraea apista]|uniref:Peptide-binding protein n=1 Tax=Pandoraea apista TaxID=93218 RepID=A0A5E5P6T8_9BURK|nr:hypothetical protein [Pandoraea apista]RRJ26260.1 hypothetical protein EIB05_23715 [Pandoraea apista]RRJ72789.1 hypothetical protein EIL82_23965 [Pandoraea apista]RSC98036.1 hypothetical protein EJB12_22935 [Pandoraea apista]RSD17562.1 hypothetical protein EIZ52_13400 [Pandoraea apista]RSK76335.1 hypothetical protein EJE83_21325 [Pandoraea apista]